MYKNWYLYICAKRKLKRTANRGQVYIGGAKDDQGNISNLSLGKLHFQQNNKYC